jgi:hypothetical protein
VAAPLIFTFEKASGFKIDRPTQETSGQGRGDLTIITDRPGATVSLNGNPVSEDFTPLTIRELGEGQWDVSVSLQGNTQHDLILIRPGKLAVARFFFDPRERAAYLQRVAAEEEARARKLAEEQKIARERHLADLARERMQMIADKIKEMDRRLHGFQMSKSLLGKREGSTDINSKTSQLGGFLNVLNGNKETVFTLSSGGKQKRWSGSWEVTDAFGQRHEMHVDGYVDISAQYLDTVTTEGQYLREYSGKWSYEWRIRVDGQSFSLAAFSDGTSSCEKASKMLPWCTLSVRFPRKTGPFSKRVLWSTTDTRRTTNEGQTVHGRADHRSAEGGRSGLAAA